MADKTERMGEEGLGSFLDAELQQTIGWGIEGDEISAERARNLEYYLNRPRGDEEDGRSKLQSSDVQDVIEALLPDTLAPFISSDKTVEFQPSSPEDNGLAKYVTEYINYIYTADNSGMMIDYTWQKDGLLQKNGFVFADWEQRERSSLVNETVSHAGLETLVADKEIEILSVSGFDEQGVPLDSTMLDEQTYDPQTTSLNVEYRRTWKEGRIRIDNIPPEYVIVSNTAVTEEDARLIGWQEQVTISDLREEGYDEAKIAKIKTSESENSVDLSGQRTARTQAQGGAFSTTTGESMDPASRKVWRTVVWTHVDYDGDGKAELRKIVRAGTAMKGGTILFNEEVDLKPIISFTPIPMPHQLFGRAIADGAISIQDGNTSMIRMAMDATYHTVHPRPVVDVNMLTDDTWDDLMMDLPAAPVRVNGQNAITQLRESPDLAAAYQLMEKFDRMRESRVPVTRQDQGLDVNELQDKTATEVTTQTNASMRRKELILRLYAHARVRLFKLILKLVIKHQDKPRQIRLMNQWVEIDPRYWNADMDAVPSVGLGTGTKDQRQRSLMLIANEQKGALMNGMPVVTPENLYNTYEALVNDSGLTSPELYFTDPKKMQGQGAPGPQGVQMMQQQKEQQAQQQQEAQKAEADKIKQAIQQAHDQGFAEGKNQMEQEKLQVNAQLKSADIASKERMKAADIASKEKMHGIDTLSAIHQASIQPATNPASQP